MSMWLRHFLFLRPLQIAVGCWAAVFAVTNPWLGALLLAVGIFFFGWWAGVSLFAHVIAKDFNRMERHLRAVHDVNARIVARARRSK